MVAADDVGFAGDLDQELLAHGPEEPLDFAPAFGPTWCGMNQAHTEFRARPQQPPIHIGRAVIDIHGLGDAAGGQRRAQRGGQPHGVLGIAPPVAGQQPGVIVQEREQIRFADHQFVSRATHLQSKGHSGARPRTGRTPPGPTRAVAPVRPSRWKLRCRVRSSGAQPSWVRRIRRIAAAVRSGFSRRSATASSSTSAGVRGVHWRGLGTSASNPPARQSRIQRSMVCRADPHPPPERVGVLARRQLAHHLSPLLGGMRRIGSLPDQLIPKQSDRPGPLGPHPRLIIADRHRPPPLLSANTRQRTGSRPGSSPRQGRLVLHRATRPARCQQPATRDGDRGLGQRHRGQREPALDHGRDRGRSPSPHRRTPRRPHPASPDPGPPRATRR